MDLSFDLDEGRHKIVTLFSRCSMAGCVQILRFGRGMRIPVVERELRSTEAGTGNFISERLAEQLCLSKVSK